MKTTHSQDLIAATMACLLAVAIGTAHAADVGHYEHGLMNIRDYAVPDPGFYFADYNYYYTTTRLNDGSGNKINSITIKPGPGPGLTLKVNVDVDIYANAPTLIWVTPWKLLGAKYGAYIAPSFANSSLDAGLSTENGRGVNPSTSSFGVGDLFVMPVWLGWKFPHWDLALGYGFYAPIGKYDTKTVTLPIVGPVKTTSPDNIGLGFWEQQVQGTVVWYPMTNMGTAVMATLTYETCGNKSDFSVTPGDDLTLNWGISQYLPLNKAQTLLVEIGPAGYDSWQITGETGSGASNSSARYQTHGVGGQIGLSSVRWDAALNFHYFYEYYSENTFQGQSFTVSIAKKF